MTIFHLYNTYGMYTKSEVNIEIMLLAGYFSYHSRKYNIEHAFFHFLIQPDVLQFFSIDLTYFSYT